MDPIDLLVKNKVKIKLILLLKHKIKKKTPIDSCPGLHIRATGKYNNEI